MREVSVGFKGTVNCLTMILQENDEFDFILKEIENKIDDAGKFFKNAVLDVKYRGKDLTPYQEKRIMDLLSKRSGATIKSIGKEEEEEKTSGLSKDFMHIPFDGLEEGMSKFYRGTLRSGHKIDFDGNVIIMGDLNPGGEIRATGNVVVLGSLRGTVHAGSNGNKNAIIVALILKPTQLRIADIITRPPDEEEKVLTISPEMAYIKNDRMYIESFLHKQ
ncbi:MAG: septum site-determining protein MinC [Clostridiales bacterium]|nr:septum site-determining protein MinC [Clostridiales bacterium]